MTHAGDPLVDASWLAAKLPPGQLQVLDASWHAASSGRDAKAEFSQAHIPAARFLDLDATSQPDAKLSHTLPTPAHMATSLSKVGVIRGKPIVVYDNAGIAPSARAWWMLKTFGFEDVKVLDGGLAAWLAAGYPVEKGEASYLQRSPEKLTHPDSRRYADLQRVREAIAKGKPVIDARSAARYYGKAPEPKAGIPSGHIKGSVNLPYQELLDPTKGILIPLEQLAERFQELDVDLTEPVICTCGSGVTACVLALALERLGHTNVAVYDGSWSEWAQAYGRDGTNDL